MTSLPANRKRITQNLRLKPKAVVQASAVAISLITLGTSPAWGLALGRVSVQSTLGETLRAEIELAEINSDEALSLHASLASPNYYRAAGLEFPSILGQVEIKLQQRQDKRHFLKVSNNQPVNEPFIDLIIEARWAAGRLVRDYTLLFSPPSLATERAAPNASNSLTLPQALALPGKAASEPEAATAAIVAPTAPAPSATASKPSTSNQTGTPQGVQTLRVKPGDTANKIALEHLPARLSLEQMLLALLRANPQAFIQENINWLKTGALLQLPSEEEVLATSPEHARDIVAVQSRDFNEFRKNLAANATRLADLPADRRAQGRVQANATDAKTGSPRPDRLTLTKDKSKENDNLDSIAGSRQRNDDEQRASAIQANIDSLQKVSEQAKVAGADVKAPATSPAESAASASEAAPKLSVATTRPGLAASADASSSTSPAVSGFLSEFLNHPLVIPATGVLLALLGAFGIYRSRQNKTVTAPHLTDTARHEEPAMESSVSQGADDTGFSDMDSEPMGTPEDVPTPDLDLDLSLDLRSEVTQPVDEEHLTALTPLSSSLPDLDFEDDQTTERPLDAPKKPEMPTFDFQGLSLELDAEPQDPRALGETTADAPTQDADTSTQPLNQATT